MPSNKKTATRRRSPPKPDIEPIHLDELLGAAGMSGFLGVLDRPAAVPHLSDVAAELALAALSDEGKRVAVWFSNQVESLVGGLGRQQEVLYGITNLARRIAGSAERLAARVGRIRLSKGEEHSGKRENGAAARGAPERWCGTELGRVDLADCGGGAAG